MSWIWRGRDLKAADEMLTSKGVQVDKKTDCYSNKKKKRKIRTNVSVRFNDVLKVMAHQEVAILKCTPSLQLATEHR